MGAITKTWRDELDRAVARPLGVIECLPGRPGFAKASWDRKMLRMVDAGLFTAYPHGGYEITAAGLEALAKDPTQ